MTMLRKVKNTKEPVEFSRLRSAGNQNFKSAAHKHDLFHKHFTKIELKPAIIRKVATCQRITLKNTQTKWAATWGCDTVRRYWSADSLFWQLLIDQTWMYHIRLQAPKLARKLTWDQALFWFRFENYIPAGKAKRKEILIQTFYETSAAHFFDFLTFAESANQNYFRCLFFWYANFSRVGKMQTGWLKNSFYLLIFSAKSKTVSTITFNFLRD